MNKTYQNIVADQISPDDMTDGKRRREFFDGLANDLQGSKEENTRGITALLNYQKAAKEMDGEEMREPSEPSIAPNTPERSLGTSVRDGLINPTELTKDLFKESTGVDFPGTGPDRSDAEIQDQDMWDGFRAANYQSGKEPKGMDEAVLEDAGGRDDQGGKPQPEGPDENTWGPSKMVKGLLTGDPKEYLKGATEVLTAGLDLNKTTDLIKKGLTGIIGMEDGPDGKKKGNLFQQMTEGLEKLSNPENSKGIEKAIKGIVGGELDAAGKAMKAVNVIATTLGGAIMGDPVAMKNLGQLDKLVKDATGPGEDMADTAGNIAGAIAYKKGRKKGLGAKEAGPTAEEAATTTKEITKDPAQMNKAGENIEKAVAAWKTVKDIGVKVAAKAAHSIPVIGTAVAIGLTIANALVNVVADAATAVAKDAVQPGQTPDMAGQGGGQAGPESKEETPDKQSPGGGAPDMADENAGQEMASKANKWKSALKKGKGALIKQFVPDDTADMGLGVAKKGLGLAQGADKKRGGDTPQEIGGLNQ